MTPAGGPVAAPVPQDRVAWRVVSPRWMHAPLSGDGAARHGGRWNRPGQRALYLSEQVETAFAEYQQELGVRPGAFMAFRIEGATLADLASSAGQREWGVEPADLVAAWKALAWVEGAEPATWRLADRLSPAHPGVRVPSVQYSGGTNLVLWRWNIPGAPQVTVLDPKGELAPHPENP